MWLQWGRCQNFDSADLDCFQQYTSGAVVRFVETRPVGQGIHLDVAVAPSSLSYPEEVQERESDNVNSSGTSSGGNSSMTSSGETSQTLQAFQG